MPDQKGIDRFIAEAEEELVRLNIKREELIARLQDLRRKKTLLAQSGNQIALSFQPPAVTNRSSEEGKITLFQSLLKGREDVDSVAKNFGVG